MCAGTMHPVTAMEHPAQLVAMSVRRRDAPIDIRETCQVMSDRFGFVVQALLFIVAIGSLLLKWSLEKPRRQLNIFALDSSKQVVGAGLIHVLNMVCAVIFSGFEAALADECAWYWVNIMIDTTFGVVICWALLKATEAVFGYDSGHYGKKSETGIDWEQNPDYSKWAAQITVWCIIVALMKLVVVVVMYCFSSFWERISVVCTHWIADRQMRLIFVMIITPTCMNMFQFWMTDSFLKYTKAAHKSVPDEADKAAEPLLQAPTSASSNKEAA